MNLIIAAGWAARAVVLLLSFVNTRLLIDRIGGEGLAAFSIVVSLTPWLALTNLGLPITVQNMISRLRGQQADYYSTRDQAFGSMLLIALAMAPVAILVGWLSHLFLLANYPFVSVGAVIGACLFIYITGQSQLLTQVMYAEHEALWPNVYPAFSSIWTTAALLIANAQGVEDFNLLLVVLSLSNLLMPVHASMKLDMFRRARFEIRETWHQIRAARDQLLFAVFSSVTLAVDYAVMSRTLEAADIVHYNLVSRLFTVILLVHGVMLSTNWSAVAELLHASESGNARRLVERVLKQGLILGGGLGLMILVAIDPAIRLWTGGKVGDVPFALGLGWCGYVLIRIWTDTYAMALLGYGMASELNRYIPIQACISAVGQYLMGRQFGAVGVVLGLILSFLLTAAWIMPTKFYQLIRSN